MNSVKTQLIEQNVRTPGATVISVTVKVVIIAMNTVLFLNSPFCGTLVSHYLSVIVALVLLNLMEDVLSDSLG